MISDEHFWPTCPWCAAELEKCRSGAGLCKACGAMVFPSDTEIAYSKSEHDKIVAEAVDDLRERILGLSWIPLNYRQDVIRLFPPKVERLSQREETK